MMAELTDNNGIEAPPPAEEPTSSTSTATTPPDDATPPPSSSRNRTSTSAPQPPQWRFVNKAKKTEGYSSAAAGTTIHGVSASDLGAKYVAPDVALYKPKRENAEVGKLRIQQPNDLEEHTVESVGKWKRSSDDKDGSDGASSHRTDKDIEAGKLQLEMKQDEVIAQLAQLMRRDGDDAPVEAVNEGDQDKFISDGDESSNRKRSNIDEESSNVPYTSTSDQNKGDPMIDEASTEEGGTNRNISQASNNDADADGLIREHFVGQRGINQEEIQTGNFAVQSGEPSQKEHNIILPSAAPGTPTRQSTQSPPKDEIGDIVITIVRGHGFIGKRRIVKTDKPDVYCKVKYGSFQWDTPHIKNDLTPVWNFLNECKYRKSDPNQELLIHVFDRNHVRGDDYYGVARTTIPKLLSMEGNLVELEVEKQTVPLLSNRWHPGIFVTVKCRKLA